MLSIELADAGTVVGEQLAAELAAAGLDTTVRVRMTDPELPDVLEFEGLGDKDQAKVEQAMARHKPNPRHSWPAAHVARADARTELRAVLAKPNPTTADNRKALELIARATGLLDDEGPGPAPERRQRAPEGGHDPAPPGEE